MLFISIEMSEDLLTRFIESFYYKRFGLDLSYSYTAIGDNKTLPEDLKDFFSEIGTTCPICGGLLLNREWEEEIAPDIDENNDLVESTREYHQEWQCSNCAYSTSSMDDLTISLDQILEKEYLTEEQKEQLKDYKFEYICREEELDDDTADWITRLNIIDNGKWVGTLTFHYDSGYNYWTNKEYILNEVNADNINAIVKLDPNSAIPKERVQKEAVTEEQQEELEQYVEVMKPTGFSMRTFDFCGDPDIGVVEEVDCRKKAMEELSNYLNSHYLYNAYILNAEKSGAVYDRHRNVIEGIFNNTDYADFDLSLVENCQFRVLGSNILNKTDCYVAPVITKLLQVIENGVVKGYILVKQQFPIQTSFSMYKVTSLSDEYTQKLCNLYAEKYGDGRVTSDIANTHIKPRSSSGVGFKFPEFPKCPECGQMFCDCKYKCKKCGQYFCTCDVNCKICGEVFCEHKLEGLKKLVENHQ